MVCSINNVEIFSAGTWNGDEYSVEDLHSMVSAFNETKSGIPPFLKLGHSDKQDLLEAEGMPAAGWVERVYVVGDKLMADFVDIPKKIYELIQNKAYRKVSCEIFWNLKLGEKIYKRVLGAVALLGAETPGVMNLRDILAMYTKISGAEPPRIYAQNAIEIDRREFGGPGSGRRPEGGSKDKDDGGDEISVKVTNNPGGGAGEVGPAPEWTQNATPSKTDSTKFEGHTIDVWTFSKAGKMAVHYASIPTAKIGLDRYTSVDKKAVVAHAKSYIKTNIKKNSIDLKVGKETKMEKTALELKLEADLAAEKEALKAQAEKVEKFSADLKAKEDELETLRKYKAQADAEKAELAQKAEEAKREAFIKDLQTDKLCTPSMKPYVAALLGAEMKKYTIGKEELSKEEILKKSFSLLKAAAEVNFEESSEAGDHENKDTEDKQIQEVKEYMAKHQVSYSQAAKAILAKNKK